MLTRRTLLLCAVATTALAASGIGASGIAHAQSADAASAFIAQIGHNLVTVVNSQDSDTAKRDKLAAVIDQSVDVPAVAQFVLGRFWRTATPAQRQEFTTLFNKVISTSSDALIFA